MDTGAAQYLGRAAPDLAEHDLVEVVDTLAVRHGRRLLLLLAGRRRRGCRHAESSMEGEECGLWERQRWAGLIGEFPDSAHSLLPEDLNKINFLMPFH